MEDFAGGVIEAYKAGVALKQQKQRFEQEQQIHDLNVQKANIELKAAKFQQQLHELALNPNPVAPEAQVAAPQPSMAPIQTSLTDSSQTETPAAPPSPATQSIPLPLPPRYVEGLNGPVAVPTVSHQQAVAATIAQHLQDIKLAAIKAGAEEQAKTAVTAPLTATEQAPGGQTLVGRGTPSEHIVPGPPAKVEPPKVSPETVTINGQGPHIALRWEQNGVVKWLDPNTGGPIQGKVDAYERPREPKDTSSQEANRTDKSYQFHTTQIVNLAKPITDRASKFQSLEDAINAGTPMADALIAPTLLSFVSGGQGSGLRMNEAEISRIVGGRSQWETIKAALNKWNTDPNKANSVLDNQRGQIQSLVSAIGSKLQAKQQVLVEAQQQLSTSEDPAEHRKVYAKAVSTLNSLDAGGSVKMVAPNGDVKDVPSDQVSHFLTLGAKIQ